MRWVFAPTFILTITFVSGCGVKGKPLPPNEPAFIGNGLPLQDKENLNKTSKEAAKAKDDNANSN